MVHQRLSPPVRVLPARARDVARTVGVPGLLRIAPGWLFFRRFEALECRLGADRAPAATLPAGVELRELAAAEIDRLCAANPALTPGLVAARLEEGVRCLLFERAGRIVHYRWYATGAARLPFVGLTYDPAAGDYLSLEAHTVHTERGSGLNSSIVAWSTAHAHALGCRRKVAFVASWNAPSLAATTRRGGFSRVGTLSELRLAGWRRLRAGGRVRIAGGRVSIPVSPGG